MAKYIDAEDLKLYMQTGLTGSDLYSPNGIDEFVESLPAADVEPVRGWILCSERMPEEEGLYLVTCFIDRPRLEIGRFYIDEDGERYFGCDWSDGEEVIAWMPLPEPYNEGEQNG